MKKREKIIIIVVLIIMIIAIIGVSYAAFSFMGEGQRLNTITTGAITMSYVESSNTISLSGALPTTDETGKVRLNPGEYFDFTVSSNITGDVNINYEISAKEVGDGTMDGSNIKLYLTRLNGDSEEELMTPETYNEETSSNSYTGRPSGEMSLYTSSMNSSESNNYRLRMWVDEDYNPQGDGGNLTFNVQINVYGLDGEKLPTAVETLLAKVNSEDLDYNSATEEEKKEMWTFTHPATEQTEALTDYRYIGSEPNNYVTFNNELWRIIGVFSVDDGTGNVEQRLKLIRDESIGDFAWKNNNSLDANWAIASLNNYLNSGDYWTNSLDSNAKNIIDNVVWYLGGSSTSTNVTPSMFYERDRGTEVFASDINFIGKVGLMYPSDYGYATSGGSTTDRNSCLNEGLGIGGWNNVSDCYNNDWIFNQNFQWTITPRSSNSNLVFDVGRNGSISAFSIDKLESVRPVVFLKSNIKIVDGDGSSSNPYILQS